MPRCRFSLTPPFMEVYRGLSANVTVSNGFQAIHFQSYPYKGSATILNCVAEGWPYISGHENCPGIFWRTRHFGDPVVDQGKVRRGNHRVLREYWPGGGTQRP